MPGAWVLVGVYAGKRDHKIGEVLDERIVVWELRTGQVLAHFTLDVGWRSTHLASATARAFSTAGDGRVAGWSVEVDRPTTRAHTGAVTGVAIAERAAYAVSVGHDATLRMWPLNNQPLAPTVLSARRQSANPKLLCVALSADGTRAVSGSADEHLVVWELDTGRHHILKPAYPISWGNPRRRFRWVQAVAVSADGTQAVSASADTDELLLWDVARGTEITRIPGTRARRLAMTADLCHGISDGIQDGPGWWDLSACRCTLLAAASPQPASPGSPNAVPVTAVALTPAGTRAAAGYADGTVALWDLGANPRPAGHLTAHAMGVHGLAFALDGARLVSASGDRTVAVWDPATGQELARAAFPAPLRCVAVSGNQVLAGDARGDLYYCRWRELSELSTPTGQ